MGGAFEFGSEENSLPGARGLMFCFFKQKTAYEITRYWSSDVCSSDLIADLLREQHAQQIRDRGGAPAALGDEPVCIGERMHARLVLGDELGEIARVARSLGKQREQLREQVAGAVAQLANHPLVALIGLAALDRTRDHICDCREARDGMLDET